MTVSNFAVAGRPLQQSAADRSLDKSVGVMFHHLADLVKIFHVIDFRHAGKLPDTLVQKRQLHPFLAFFLQGRSFFPVFFFLPNRLPEKLRPFLAFLLQGRCFFTVFFFLPDHLPKILRPFLAFLLQGPNREKLPHPDSPVITNQTSAETKLPAKAIPPAKSRHSSPPAKNKHSAGPAHIRKSSHITDSHNQSSGL